MNQTPPPSLDEVDASSHASGQPILFSVIIPTCHRNMLLARCLDSLAPGAQADGRSAASSLAYEVVVTDDGVEKTADALLQGRYPWARWVPGPHRGPAANRNHGARQARGDWLAFIDDDCIADPGWLAGLRRDAISGGLDVIEGRTTVPGKRDSPFLHAVENVTGGCFWSCNLAVRRDTFWRIGGFDERFLSAGGEDMEFAWRMRREGLRSCFCAEAIVRHPQRPHTLGSFLRRIWEAKWILLYRQLTNISPPDSAPARVIGMTVIRAHLFGLVRNTVYGWAGIRGNNWRTKLFGIAWPWVILPLQLPHLLWWEFRFRRERRPAT